MSFLSMLSYKRISSHTLSLHSVLHSFHVKYHFKNCGHMNTDRKRKTYNKAKKNEIKLHRCDTIKRTTKHQPNHWFGVLWWYIFVFHNIFFMFLYYFLWNFMFSSFLLYLHPNFLLRFSSLARNVKQWNNYQ